MYCGKKSISGAFELIDSRWRSTAPTAHSEAQRATSVCARSVQVPGSLAAARSLISAPGSLARPRRHAECIFPSPNIQDYRYYEYM